MKERPKEENNEKVVIGYAVMIYKNLINITSSHRKLSTWFLVSWFTSCEVGMEGKKKKKEQGNISRLENGKKL